MSWEMWKDLLESLTMKSNSSSWNVEPLGWMLKYKRCLLHQPRGHDYRGAKWGGVAKKEKLSLGTEVNTVAGAGTFFSESGVVSMNTLGSSSVARRNLLASEVLPHNPHSRAVLYSWRVYSWSCGLCWPWVDNLKRQGWCHSSSWAEEYSDDRSRSFLQV